MLTCFYRTMRVKVSRLFAPSPRLDHTVMSTWVRSARNDPSTVGWRPQATAEKKTIKNYFTTTPLALGYEVIITNEIGLAPSMLHHILSQQSNLVERGPWQLGCQQRAPTVHAAGDGRVVLSGIFLLVFFKSVRTILIMWSSLPYFRPKLQKYILDQILPHWLPSFWESYFSTEEWIRQFDKIVSPI